ncbi:MAG: hypothetical protein FWD21_02475 [Peptococcaceae bacterium]|nr:hypothetical protein [Peptococcaceae bacterium]
MNVKYKRMFIGMVVALAMVSALGYSAFAVTGNEPGGSGDPLVTQSYVDQFTQWRVLELRTDQVMRCYAGTEFIMRRGHAVIVDSTGNGIPNVTGGEDIYANGIAPLNHMLIVPRDDGRGIKALSPVVVLYRGHVTVN